MICFMMNPSRKHIWASREEINMDQVVITIARQYGSGGRTIGEMLAKKLNVHYYDKELMKLAQICYEHKGHLLDAVEVDPNEL